MYNIVGFYCGKRFANIIHVCLFFLPAVPPSIIEDVSPSSVICEMQNLCSLSCHATSVSPFNYSWTKNGQVPVSDDIKIMSNIIVLTPRDAEDYGVYVCHATNRFDSTAYEIAVSECQKGEFINIMYKTLQHGKW